MTFEQILSAVHDAPGDELKSNILSGIFHDSATVRSLVAGENSLKQVLTNDKLPGAELLTHFGLRPYSAKSDAVTAVGRLLSDPDSFGDELALVLQRFWQTGFKQDWAALGSSLRAEAFHLKELHENASAAELTRELNFPVVLDDATQELRSKTGTTIEYDRIERLYVMPSAFNTRKWWAKYASRPQRFSLYFPIAREGVSPNKLAEDDWPARESVRPARVVEVNAEAVFRALGDTTRFAIASMLARTPTTSAELARSLKVSKPTITHHVQALRAAGLIDEAPEGGSTRLSLNRGTVAALSNAAVEHFFSSTGDVALATTRKRRNT
jgi:DNA-binding transcriptional ArsR family regulator